VFVEAANWAFPALSKSTIILANPAHIQGVPMREPSALRKASRVVLAAASVSILVWLPTAAMAQRVADRQQDTVPSSTTASSIMTKEGVRKAIIFTYRDGNLIQQYKYYLWHDACYLTYEPNNSAAVPPPACQ
jgi:hypothetical protein